MRTRVGYAGGDKENPTYRSLGDHTEAIAIDYDPKVISYEDLLRHFFDGHNCAVSFGGRQYMNAVFYHDATQKKLAEQARNEAAKRRGIRASEVKTGIFPATAFTYAEEYHQKYALTRHPQVRAFLLEHYPGPKALADSTVATKLNAWLGSGLNHDRSTLAQEIESFGLPENLQKYVLSAAKMR